MNASKIQVVPDTNLFFQCKDITELPWEELGDFSIIELIITRPVQKEIDRRKGESNTRLGRKARKAHSILSKVIENGLRSINIRKGKPDILVSLQVGIKPNSNLNSILNYDEPDDQLVGIASTISESNPLSTTVVLTHDSGVLASALAVGVKHHAISGSWLAPPEKTNVEKQLEAAQKEIELLKKSGPIFEIDCIDEENSKLDRLICVLPKARELSLDEIEKLVKLAKENFPEKTKFLDASKPLTNPTKMYNLRESMRRFEFPLTNQQIESYHTAYVNWESNLRSTLQDVHIWLESETQKMTATFTVRNVGTRPAEKVLVVFKAHGEFQLERPSREDGELDKNARCLPAPPSVPKYTDNSLLFKHDFRKFGHLAGFESANLLNPAFIPEPHDPEEFYYKTGSTGQELKLSSDFWRHGRESERFQALVNSAGQPVAGAIEFSVHASNLARSASIRIPLKIEISKPSTFEYASKLIYKLRAANSRP